MTTEHFEKRKAQRNLPEDVLDFILQHGTEFHRAGAVFYTVVEKKLHPRVNPVLRRHARGWIVVTAPEENRLVTCYRRDNALAYIQRKPKRSAKAA